MIVLFIFGIMSIAAYMTFDSINTDIQASTDLDANTKQTSQQLYNNFAPTLDAAFLMAFVLFTIFAIVSVFFLDTHPVYFILAVILLFAVFIVGGFLANAWDDVMSDESLAPYANDFRASSFIMGNLLESLGGVVVLILIALFAKFRSGV
tara:strand:+ start:720 stop:1169 length:450 start_codon:yes stop_codon:yes gene_type:complete